MVARILLAFLGISLFGIPQSEGICFVETEWQYFMENLLTENYVNMTADLCMEGCLSNSSCTGISVFGTTCCFYGKVYTYGMTGCIGQETYWKRTPGCVNPANKVSFNVGDAQGKQITFNYNVWTNTYSYAGKNVVGVLTPAQSSSNIKYIYEPDWDASYINRPDGSMEGFVNYTIDFPADKVGSISVYTAEVALYNEGAFVAMQACSWTRCEDISSGVRSLIYPTTGSFFTSPFRFCIRLGGPVGANPQAYRYMYDTATQGANPKSLEIIFNLK